MNGMMDGALEMPQVIMSIGAPTWNGCSYYGVDLKGGFSAGSEAEKYL